MHFRVYCILVSSHTHTHTHTYICGDKMQGFYFDSSGVLAILRFLTLMSELRLLILFMPAFSRWKLAQRSSSSSGESFIRSSSVSPSRSRAAKAGEGGGQDRRVRGHPNNTEHHVVA